MLPAKDLFTLMFVNTAENRVNFEEHAKWFSSQYKNMYFSSQLHFKMTGAQTVV